MPTTTTNRYAFSKEAVMTAFLAGEYDRVLAMLHGERSAGCAVVRTRTYVRILEFERAMRACEEGLSYAQDWRENRELALAHAYLGPLDELATVAERILADALARKDLLLVAESRFALLQAEFIRSGTLSQLSAVFSSLDDSELAQLRKEQTWYWYETNFLRARALQSASHKCAAEGNRADEERLLIESLLTIRLCLRRDFFYECVIATNLAFFVRHFKAVSAKRFVEMTRDVMPNSIRVLPGFRNYISRALSINEWVHSESTADSRTVLAPSPSILERLITSVDFLLFGPTDDRQNFVAATVEVCEMARRTEWIRDIDHCEDVLLLIAAIAPHDVSLANSFKFSPTKRTDVVRAIGSKIDQEYRASPENLAEAAVAKANGELDKAAAFFRLALEHFRKHGMQASAAIAGLELYSITKFEPDLADVSNTLRDHPNTAFGRRLARGLVRVKSQNSQGFSYLGQA